VAEGAERIRTRDPARKQRILAAAADLVAQRGYHAVGMADIGAAAGVTGSAIYRHFDSKSAVLVALFDRVIDELLMNAHAVIHDTTDAQAVLEKLVRDQVRFAIEDRELLQVYLREIQNLPEEDRRRLRRKQRLYLEEWVHVLCELRNDLIDTEARAVVHATIGAIQSVLHYQRGLPQERLAELMTQAAAAVLGVDAPSTHGADGATASVTRLSSGASQRVRTDR
jgi:AcrR family transcriptional regulator